jgi:hypothetical protein
LTQQTRCRRNRCCYKQVLLYLFWSLIKLPFKANQRILSVSSVIKICQFRSCYLLTLTHEIYDEVSSSYKNVKKTPIISILTNSCSHATECCETKHSRTALYSTETPNAGDTNARALLVHQRLRRSVLLTSSRGSRSKLYGDQQHCCQYYRVREMNDRWVIEGITPLVIRFNLLDGIKIASTFEVSTLHSDVTINVSNRLA